MILTGRNMDAAEAERANHAKDELLSHVSHELRTPLHAVLGYAELLELDDRSERDRDALMQIQFNGRRLLTMVEDLIELGDATSAPAVVDVELGEFLDEAIEGLGPSATSRRIGIEAHPGLHGTVVHTEPARLRQVLYCSLSGAVQSIDGGGTVTVDVQVPAHHTASTDATAPHPSPGNMSPAATSSGTFAIEMHLTGTQPLREADMIMPMALALIEGHGSIDLHRVSPERVDVTIRFDQVINP